jgi:hypothetical protein
MTPALQATIKKLLQEFGNDIKDADEFTAKHVHQFIELAVVKFGASQDSAQRGLAYASAWPAFLQKKLADIEAGVVAEVKKVETEVKTAVNSILQAKPASAPIVQPGAPVQQPAAKKDMSFDVTK